MVVMPMVRHRIGYRRLLGSTVRRVSAACAVITMIHARHRPRRRDPVQDQRESEDDMEQRAGHGLNRLRRTGESFNMMDKFSGGH